MLSLLPLSSPATSAAPGRSCRSKDQTAKRLLRDDHGAAASLTGGLRNPLMGFIVDVNDGMEAHPWVTLGRHYIKWNEIENSESDSVEKIRAFLR
jgi:hypothetical protein